MSRGGLWITLSRAIDMGSISATIKTLYNSLYSSMIGDIIKQQRTKAGLTQEQVAKKARTPRAYISQIESGVRSPSDRVAEDILIKGIGLEYSQAQRIISQWKLQKIGLPQELESVAETGFAPVPVLGSVPCGEPKEVYEDANGYISLPKSRMPEGHRLFAVLAEGLSMVGEDIVPGDIVICDPDAEVRDGDMAIVRVEDGATLKRLHFRDGYAKLESANKGFVPMETSRLQIVAKVIYIIKKY